MPRPKKQIKITPEQYIADLAALGHSKAEIARLLDISVDTLDRRYAAIYAKGREAGKSKIRRKLIDTALAGNVVALIFLAKAMLGLKETSAVELSGPEGSPLQITNARERLSSFLDGISARQPAADVPGEPD